MHKLNQKEPMIKETVIIDDNYPKLKKSHDSYFGDCYLFDGNIEIDGNLIIETSIPLIVKGDQSVEGYQIVKGDQIVEGYQRVEGDQRNFRC